MITKFLRWIWRDRSVERDAALTAVFCRDSRFYALKALLAKAKAQGL